MNTKSIITDDETRKTEKLNYSRPLEHLIKNKAEECEVLSKLHLMSHKKYDHLEMYFNVAGCFVYKRILVPLSL